jgi:hypothetical protein
MKKTILQLPTGFPWADLRRGPLPVIPQRLMAMGLLLLIVGNSPAQPVITNQPQSQTNVVGTTATFTVEASGTPPLAYQWQRDVTGFQAWTDLAGSIDPVLRLTNITVSDTLTYRVVVTNSEGSVTSAVANLTVIVPPQVISVINLYSTVSLGGKQALRASASGTAPLQFQWFLKGTTLLGQNSYIINFTNVQRSDLGSYAVVVSNFGGSVTSNPVELDVDPTFTKITSDPVVTNAAPWPGFSWGDYDNDGYIDLFVANSAWDTRPVTNYLYHNLGNGGFELVRNSPVVTDKGFAVSGVWGDFDNDGNLDLFVANAQTSTGLSANTNFLYHNLGNGQFVRSNSDPVVTTAREFGNALLADYDHDGNLDLFFFRWYGGAARKNSLFHNNGTGSFTEVTAAGPWQNAGPYNGSAAWGDCDNDGWPDLAIVAGNFCHNEGGGKFKSLANGVSSTGDSVAALAWGDYDNDGLLDLLVVCAGNYGTHAPNSLLLHNEGNGQFRIVLLGPSDYSIAGCWADYDNDGYLDIFITQGLGSTSKPNLLYHNNGDGTFTKVNVGSPVTESGSYGDAGFGACAWGDYDNDGFLDLIYGSTTGLHFFHNNGNTNHWIKLKLIGTVSNRSAIGAKVRVKATIGGKTFWQLREVSTGTGFAQDDMRPNFGLGDATSAEVVRVEWPSGQMQEFYNVPANQIVTITEPPGLAAVSCPEPGLLRMQLQGNVGSIYDLFTSTNLVDWVICQSIISTNRKMLIEHAAPPSAQRFYRAALP